MIRLAPLADADAQAIESLLDAAFGADRHARTAYRLRDGVAAIPELSFAAFAADGTLVGSVQCWPVELAGDDGHVAPLVLVGPVAVAPALQRGGIGRRLARAALDAADARGVAATMLIGDPEYYGRFFGYAAAPTAGWRLPGTVERRRLLARVAPGTILPHGGEVRARLPAANRA